MTNQPISREEVARLRALLAKHATLGPKGPWKVVPADGKPIIASARGGNLFRGYIATWVQADLVVAAVNALPALLDAADRLAAPTDAETVGLRIAERIRQEMTSDRQWWLDALSPDQRVEFEGDLASTCVAICEDEFAAPTDAGEASEREALLPPIPNGHARGWYRCELHDRYGYADYVPYSFSSAVSVMPCGCDTKNCQIATEAEARAALKGPTHV